MKKSRFTEEKIIFALKQAKLGTSVPDVCRKLGISYATFFVWRKKYGGISPSELSLARLHEWVRDLQARNGNNVSRVCRCSSNGHAATNRPSADNRSHKVCIDGRVLQRQECLNENWFMSLEDARCKSEAWRIHYNQRRPHSALRWMTTSEFAEKTVILKGLMSILGAGVKGNSNIDIIVYGADELDAMNEIKGLFASGFGEKE